MRALLLPEGQTVQIETKTLGRILHEADTLRSYVIKTPTRRNCIHLRPHSKININEPPVITTARPVTRLLTGATIHPPDCLRP